VQAAVNALYKSLRWIDKASLEEIAAAVPEQYHLGDKALYIKALGASKEAYSKTGIMAPEGMKSVYDMLKGLDPEMANVTVDLTKTFDPRFALRAASLVT
jgi:NitT/TauT family transport system substrate-binding protein